MSKEKAKPKRFNWTLEKRRKLEQLLKENKGFKHISQELGVNKECYMHERRRPAHRGVPYDAERAHEVERLYKKTKHSTVGAGLQYKLQYVYDAIRFVIPLLTEKLPIDCLNDCIYQMERWKFIQRNTHRPITKNLDDYKDEIISKTMQGLSPSAIARELNITRLRVVKLIEEYYQQNKPKEVDYEKLRNKYTQ